MGTDSSIAIPYRRVLIISTLIIAGEAVFFLPFVIARIFRPTFLEVFQISNFQLGTAFSAYGIVALLSYFAGGPLADRFSARKLMAIALVVTAGGGIYLTQIPSMSVLILLYIFWGISTILLFWSALHRATREWGGDSAQGTAFGLLDGGRGLVAAVMASLTVTVFASLLPENVDTASLAQRSEALSKVIWIFIGVMVLVAGMILFFVPESPKMYLQYHKKQFDLSIVGQVVRKPAIWLQSIIILCAYVGFKCTDDFSLYAYDAFGYDDVEAARLGTLSYWVRPFAAILAGILADRWASSTVAISGFLTIAFGSICIGSGWLQGNTYWLIALTVVITSVGIYGVRGIYFAFFQESKMPFALTGTAVGVVSVIGYTPDIFMGPVMGYLTDNYPGASGHQYLFFLLCGFSIVGAACSYLFRKMHPKYDH